MAIETCILKPHSDSNARACPDSTSDAGVGMDRSQSRQCCWRGHGQIIISSVLLAWALTDHNLATSSSPITPDSSLSSHYSISLPLPIMPSHYPFPSCHLITLSHHAISLPLPIMPFHYPFPSCHLITPFCHPISLPLPIMPSLLSKRSADSMFHFPSKGVSILCSTFNTQKSCLIFQAKGELVVRQMSGDQHAPSTPKPDVKALPL